MRIISAPNPHYNPGSYHYGSVWPLFTGRADLQKFTAQYIDLCIFFTRSLVLFQ